MVVYKNIKCPDVIVSGVNYILQFVLLIIAVAGLGTPCVSIFNSNHLILQILIENTNNKKSLFTFNFVYFFLNSD